MAVFTAITFLFCLLGGRFFYVQVLWQEELLTRALDQWTREIPVVAERGQITAQGGEVLVDNDTLYTIFVRSNAVKDKDGTAKVLADALGLDATEITKKLSGAKASEMTVARRVEKSVVETLSAHSLDGVYFSRDNARIYPYGESLCQVLGFTSYDGTGTTGIEKYYDKYLSGENGELLYETDLIGIELDGAVAAYRPATDGYNVQLTVDYGIQTVVETALKRVAQMYSPASAECIVVDPKTFEILAMANYPSYDLNDIPRDDIDLLNTLSRNKTVSDIYEPGSTFKIITAAANLEEWKQGNGAAYSPNRIFSSSRTRSVDGTTVKCWNSHGNGRHSNQTLAEALNNSCNPCFTDMALSLGTDKFYKYLSAFGFGKTTGIDYGGEALGMLLPQAAVRNCDLARIGFGQTVAVTALQLACATAAAVNGGYYYTPHLVKSVYAKDGYVAYKAGTTLQNRTLSEETSRLLAEMLEGVVTNGSGKKAYIEGYRVGGKTGVSYHWMCSKFKRLG